jgi:hypothetical protein
MRPVAGRGLKIEGHIRLRINDLGGGRYLDTPSDRSFDASHDPHPGVQETGCDTHRRCSGEVLVGLLALVHAPVELAEAEVAVGDEGAHAERLGERERVTIAAGRVLRGDRGGGASRYDIT